MHFGFFEYEILLLITDFSAGWPGFSISSMAINVLLSVGRQDCGGWRGGREPSWPFLLLSFSIFGWEFLVKNTLMWSKALMTQYRVFPPVRRELLLIDLDRTSHWTFYDMNPHTIVLCPLCRVLLTVKCGNITFPALKLNWNSKLEIK